MASEATAKGEYPAGALTPLEPQVAALMQKEGAAGLAVRTLQQAVDKHLDNGFMSIGIESDRVVLRWKGALPPEIKSTIETAERTAPVDVRPSVYSRAELDVSAERIAHHIETNPKDGVHTVAVLGDGSGLRVGTTGNVTTSQGALPTVEVPVQTVSAPSPQLLSRNDDSAPWWGGSRIRNASRGWGTNQWCSSAFPVTNSSGGQWLLTAAHCATPPDLIGDGVGHRIGAANRENWQHDVLLVSATVKGSGQGKIFTGGLNDHTSLPIAGWAHAYVGEHYCQGGVTTVAATGGQLCGLKVLPDFTKRVCGTDSDGDWTCVSDLVSAQRIGGQLSARPGDSGGPVYSIGGDNRVLARGLVSGTPDGGRTLYFQDFATVNRDMNVWPVTG